jgi:SAM-dependent methyltransferase
MAKTLESVYDHPKYYDMIFNAEWKPELRFLETMFRRHIPGKTKSVFEPACGTGRLLMRFAKSGYAVAGNDLNPHAVKFCNQRLTRHGFQPTAMEGDMARFQLKRPVDAAFNTINSFRHLDSHRAAVDHLNCMAAAIRPGGIYVLGFHLTPTVGKPEEDEKWTARRGKLTVQSSMWLIERNLRLRYEIHGLKLNVKTPSQKFTINDALKFRTYTAPQIRQLLKQVPQFRLVAIHDFHYDPNHHIELDSSVQDAVFVLQVC